MTVICKLIRVLDNHKSIFPSVSRLDITRGATLKAGILATTLGTDTGYPHDGRADNAAYRHDRRADKRRYRHDREIDTQMLKCLEMGTF